MNSPHSPAGGESIRTCFHLTTCVCPLTADRIDSSEPRRNTLTYISKRQVRPNRSQGVFSPTSNRPAAGAISTIADRRTGSGSRKPSTPPDVNSLMSERVHLHPSSISYRASVAVHPPSSPPPLIHPFVPSAAAPPGPGPLGSFPSGAVSRTTLCCPRKARSIASSSNLHHVTVSRASAVFVYLHARLSIVNPSLHSLKCARVHHGVIMCRHNHSGHAPCTYLTGPCNAPRDPSPTHKT